ncbi:MAG: threonine ammonia-lyase [Sarcina sp.]
MYLNKIKNARKRISENIIKTPLMYSKSFSEICDNEVYIKCENLQITGAYKLRGALNKLSLLSEEDRKRGVICSSAGNHAQGVAYAASLYNISSTIVMPKTTPLLKVNSTKELGGNVVIHGDVYDDAFNKATELEFVLLSEKHKLIAEPSGVVSLSALKKLKNTQGKKIVSIISGGNIDMITMSSLIKTGLVSRGRLFAFSMELPHIPGELVKVSTILSELNANIVELEHNRFKATDHLRNVVLEVTVETNGLDHINVIKKELTSRGYIIKQIY